MPPLPVSAPSAAINLRNYPLSEFCQTVLGDILKKPFVLSPEVIAAEDRLTYGNLKLSAKDAEGVLRKVLESRGFALQAGPIYYVTKAEIKDKDGKTVKVSDKQLRVTYQPKHRALEYFSETLPQVFPNAKFSFTKSDKKDAIGLDRFFALVDEKDKESLDELFEQLDKPLPQVAVRAMLVEVSSDEKSGSGFKLATTLFADKLSFSVGAQPAGNVFVFKAGGVEAAFGVFDGDSRFRTLTSPSLVIEHSRTGDVLGGTKVPVSSSTTNQGATSQDTKYLDVGTKLSVKPEVLGDSISLNIKVELSEAQITSTGANSAPQLITRSANTQATVQNKSVLVIGGIAGEREARSANKLFGINWSSNSTSSQSELVLILYAEII